MAEITARGNIPLLVGGTMLYFKALLEGLADMPAADAQVRAELEAEAAQLGWQALHAQLAAVDPESAARIHPNDPQRLVRALEVYRVSGMTMTSHRERQSAQSSVAGASGQEQLPLYCRQPWQSPRRIERCCTSELRYDLGKCWNRASSTRSDHCVPEVTCMQGCRLYGQSVIARSGITLMAS